MATIVATTHSTTGTYTPTVTTLGASDTFTFKPNVRQVLELVNPTGGNITVTLDGAGGTSVSKQGVGAIDVSAGKSFTVNASSRLSIPLNLYSDYLQGVIAVTGGTGLTAVLLEG